MAYTIYFRRKVIASTCSSGWDVETSHLDPRNSVFVWIQSHLDIHSCINTLPATASDKEDIIYGTQCICPGNTHMTEKLECIEMDMIWSMIRTHFIKTRECELLDKQRPHSYGRYPPSDTDGDRGDCRPGYWLAWRMLASILVWVKSGSRCETGSESLLGRYNPLVNR